MNWRKVQQAEEAGDKQIALRLLEPKLHELLAQAALPLGFPGRRALEEKRKRIELWEVKGCPNGA